MIFSCNYHNLAFENEYNNKIADRNFLQSLSESDLDTVYNAALDLFLSHYKYYEAKESVEFESHYFFNLFHSITDDDKDLAKLSEYIKPYILTGVYFLLLENISPNINCDNLYTIYYNHERCCNDDRTRKQGNYHDSWESFISHIKPASSKFQQASLLELQNYLYKSCTFLSTKKAFEIKTPIPSLIFAFRCLPKYIPNHIQALRTSEYFQDVSNVLTEYNDIFYSNATYVEKYIPCSVEINRHLCDYFMEYYIGKNRYFSALHHCHKTAQRIVSEANQKMDDITFKCFCTFYKELYNLSIPLHELYANKYDTLVYEYFIQKQRQPQNLRNEHTRLRQFIKELTSIYGVFIPTLGNIIFRLLMTICHYNICNHNGLPTGVQISSSDITNKIINNYFPSSKIDQLFKEYTLKTNNLYEKKYEKKDFKSFIQSKTLLSAYNFLDILLPESNYEYLNSFDAFIQYKGISYLNIYFIEKINRYFDPFELSKYASP